MTRKTPIPLLRNLESCRVIERCKLCGDLTFLSEICRNHVEAKGCPLREDLEGKPCSRSDFDAQLNLQ